MCGGLTRDVNIVLMGRFVEVRALQTVMALMMMAVMVMMVAVVCRRWFVDEIVPAFCG